MVDRLEVILESVKDNPIIYLGGVAFFCLCVETSYMFSEIERNNQRLLKEHTSEVNWEENDNNYSCKLERSYEAFNDGTLKISFLYGNSVAEKFKVDSQICREYNVYFRNEEQELLESLAGFPNHPLKECARRFLE